MPSATDASNAVCMREICIHLTEPMALPIIYLTICLIYTLSDASVFENIVTKEEIAQNEQFLLLPQCFQLFVIGYPFNYIDFLCFDKICSKSSVAELSYEGKG